MIPPPTTVDDVLLLAFASLLVVLSARFAARIAPHLEVDFVVIFRIAAEAMVKLAARLLPRPYRDRYRSEWLGELDALRTETAVAPTFSLLFHAAGWLFTARGLARELVPAPALSLRENRHGPGPVRPRAHEPDTSRPVFAGAWFARGARRRARMKQRLRRLILTTWVITVLGALAGLPFADSGFGLSLVDRIGPLKPSGGIETTEITKDLLRERAVLQNESP